MSHNPHWTPLMHALADSIASTPDEPGPAGDIRASLLATVKSYYRNHRVAAPAPQPRALHTIEEARTLLQRIFTVFPTLVTIQGRDLQTLTDQDVLTIVGHLEELGVLEDLP